MSSKLTNADVLASVEQLRTVMKARKFTETIELQVALKDYDPMKDKRFVGSVRLPNVPRPTLKICLIGDAKHEAEAKAANLDIDVTSLDELKKFNKDKKLVKKWAKKYSILLASDTVLKKVPVVVGPILTRIQRFPQVVSHKESLEQKVLDTRASVKFQLKKVTCMNTAVGRADMSDEEIKQNVMMSLNFLASLLKKGWHNIKAVYIKSTMSSSIKLL